MIELDDHLVDLSEDICSQPLTELNQKRWCERRFLLITGKTDEVLAIRILRDLFQQFSISIAVLLLNDQQSQRGT